MKLYNITVHVRDEYRTAVFADDWKTAYEQAEQEYRDGVYPERLKLSTTSSSIGFSFPCRMICRGEETTASCWEDVSKCIESLDNKNGIEVYPLDHNNSRRLIIHGSPGNTATIHLIPFDKDPRKTEGETNERSV